MGKTPTMTTAETKHQCHTCKEWFVVPSLARDCEIRHRNVWERA